MKPGEIYRSYKDAGCSRNQIGILAELNAVGTAVIEKIISEEEAKTARTMAALRNRQEHSRNAPLMNAGAGKMYDSSGYNIRHQIGSGSDNAFYLSLHRSSPKTGTSGVKSDTGSHSNCKQTKLPSGRREVKPVKGVIPKYRNRDTDLWEVTAHTTDNSLSPTEKHAAGYEEREIMQEKKQVVIEALSLAKDAEKTAEAVLNQAKVCIKASEEMFVVSRSVSCINEMLKLASDLMEQAEEAAGIAETLKISVKELG